MAIIGTQEHVSFELAGQQLEVLSLVGQERLSRLFDYRVECAIAGPAPAATPLIGAAATITMHDGFGKDRIVKGIASEVTTGTYDNGLARMTVVVRPAVYPLTVGRDCRAFQDSTVPEIVQQVLAETSVPARWELTRTYRKRSYTVQYREDDWTFCARLLEQEGIYVWFDHAEGSILVFADDSTAAPDAPGGASIVYAWQSGAHADGEVIEELASGVKAVTTKFTVGSFDFKRPLLKIRESVGEGPLEVYVARGGGPPDPSVAARQASVLQEAAEAAKYDVAGITTSVRLAPGVVFDVHDHQLAELDGRYLVTGLGVKVRQRTREGAGEQGSNYDCHFTAIPVATPYRPPAETPAAKQLGAQSGVVVGPPGEEIHTDNHGRVRVQQYWDRLGTRDDKSGKWMRVAQRGSAESMLYPRMGWTVLTFNEEGSIDAPSVFNRIPDGEHLPPYALPANKTRLTFKTATTPGGGSFNEIRFEDRMGEEEMFLNASRDMNILIQKLRNDVIERDQQRSVGVDHKLTIHQSYFTLVGRDQTVSIGANEKIEAGAGASKVVQGNETISIGGTRKLTAGGDSTLAAKGSRRLSVGAAMIDLSLGPINGSGGFYTVLVGGAMVRLSGATISDDVGKVSVQLIGGAKLETVKCNRATDVKKTYKETVGGTMMLKTNGVFLDNADQTSRWQVGAALSASAPNVWIEAKEKIVLKCGGSSLTIEPDKIEIKAAAFDLDGGKLQFDSKKLEHN